MCNCCRHNCFLTISVQTTGSNIKFPESERLRQNKILSVSARRANGQVKLTPEGWQIAADTVVYSSHLNLVDNSAKPVAQIPVETLWRDTNAPEPLAVDWSNIDPTQSYITLNTASAGYNAANAIELVFEIACPPCNVP